MSERKLQILFEIKSIEPEEKKELAKLYSDETPDPTEYVRIGPKGYLVIKKYETMASDIYNMELRPTDIFVASYQRSGTTITQELVWLIIKDLDFETAKSQRLTERYPFLEYAMYFDPVLHAEAQKVLPMLGIPATEILRHMPDPRFVKTHLPMSLLPPNILDKTTMIYVARDPRDVIVSSYHQNIFFRERMGFKCDFKQYWNVFRKDLFILTPYFEHIKEAWSLRHHPNMLFLFYEELIKDMPVSIRRIADFLGKKLTDAQAAALCDHLKIENFKKNAAVNFEELRPVGALASGETFIRKGKPGGWREYFDDEMTLECQCWIDQNLKGSDLNFPSMQN